MKVKFLLVAVLLVGGFNVSAQAQRQFAGNYNVLSGYTTGQAFGLFGYGTATISTAGAASYTVYYPRLGSSGRGSGRINSLGTFSMNNGVTGSAQIYGTRVAIGAFRDAYGTGWFGMRKK